MSSFISRSTVPHVTRLFSMRKGTPLQIFKKEVLGPITSIEELAGLSFSRQNGYLQAVADIYPKFFQKKVDLQQVGFSSQSWKAFCKALDAQESIEAVSLKHVCIEETPTSEIMKDLLCALEGKSSITQLAFEMMFLGEESSDAIESGLGKLDLSNLKALSFADNEIGNQQVLDIVDAVEKIAKEELVIDFTKNYTEIDLTTPSIVGSKVRVLLDQTKLYDNSYCLERAT